MVLLKLFARCHPGLRGPGFGQFRVGTDTSGSRGSDSVASDPIPAPIFIHSILNGEVSRVSHLRPRSSSLLFSPPRDLRRRNFALTSTRLINASSNAHRLLQTPYRENEDEEETHVRDARSRTHWSNFMPCVYYLAKFSTFIVIYCPLDRFPWLSSCLYLRIPTNFNLIKIPKLPLPVLLCWKINYIINGQKLLV